MARRPPHHVLLVVLVSMLPAVAAAQEATISGAVTDSSGAVLPGVTVTVVHEASGNVFTAVTDERGNFRIPVRVGVHSVRAELSGFATVARSVDLLLRQQVVLNLELAPSSVQETVTVTADAPLLDVAGSELSSNIDPTQMQELPVNGRNWQQLALLAPGMRANAVTDSPVSGGMGNYQINLDGQQITNDYGANSFGGPRFSRDAIGEFEFVSSRFDATQGRSSGVQVNAITKSGTNMLSGSFSGYFRDQKFNAADFIEKRALPYSDQQLSGTLGGPIVRDRLHYFLNYEFEREPQTFTYNSPYLSFNIDQGGTRTEHKGGIRLDFQLASQSRLMIRGNKYDHNQPFNPQWTGGATRHPSTAQSSEQFQDEWLGTLNYVLNDRTLNELSVGYAEFSWRNLPVVSWSAHPHGSLFKNRGTPVIQFNGYRVGQGEVLTPADVGIRHYSLRNNLITSFRKGGRHDLKAGGEFLYVDHVLDTCRNCMGIYDAQGGPIPANIEALFPVWNDPSTWNLAAISPIVRRYTIGVGKFPLNQPRPVYAAWIQDDWTINSRLTLNLGVRYDFSRDAFAENVGLPPFLQAGRPQDTNNIGPRLGFAYAINPRTVLRGGTGKYYGDVTSGVSHFTKSQSQIAVVEVLNDGRPNFAADPFNGRPLPTHEEAIASTIRDLPGAISSPDLRMPSSYQSSIGIQRQYGDVMSVTVDYVLVLSRDEILNRNTNLSFDPATGINYRFTDITKRPYQGFAVVNRGRPHGKTDSHSLQAALTKRMRNDWQASATYTLGGDWTFDPQPLNPSCTNPIQPSGACDIAFTVAPDLGEGKMHWDGTQRHRFVFNGIWKLGYGVQLSGLYFFGSGVALTPTSGVDVRGTGSTNTRLRRDGTIIPWSSFSTEPLHRVDMRVQRRFSLGGRTSLDGIVEVFNVFNRANFGSWVTNESNRSYGQPSFNNNVAYAPRMLQLGFRLVF